jgi:hypothetical protein
MLRCVRVDLGRSRLFRCAFEAAALVSGYSISVCNKKQLYALVDAETGILLIYSLFLKKNEKPHIFGALI